MFLNEQKVKSVPKAAVMADEFILTHKNVFVLPPDKLSAARPLRSDLSSPERSKDPSTYVRDARVFLLP